ncbi:hypothetical protein LuPra_02745 [Luteitalea pratensis]|uniref:Uncharacterized protein n=1 Tax=Luteitalea pratensis TaxID=1855912 RepID=A0A143PN60_LUTPR|nr:hypothetical protein [Luteitalea pratensis]AMY09528.1 hypothetical protein LuPra_02745 [Luteitalea pratensis]
MRPHRGFRYLACPTIPAILVMLMVARGAHGQEPVPVVGPQAPASVVTDAIPAPAPAAVSPFKVLISEVRLKRSAELALGFASARVAANGCGGLLSEFVDEQGQPLAARLETLRMSLQDYLHTVYFLDGSDLRSCRGPMAVTTPGSRVVYVCGGLVRQSHGDAWVTIIHEVLHSLGLAENPPSPAFISNRVRKLCH